MPLNVRIIIIAILSLSKLFEIMAVVIVSISNKTKVYMFFFCIAIELNILQEKGAAKLNHTYAKMLRLPQHLLLRLLIYLYRFA